MVTIEKLMLCFGSNVIIVVSVSVIVSPQEPAAEMAFASLGASERSSSEEYIETSPSPGTVIVNVIITLYLGIEDQRTSHYGSIAQSVIQPPSVLTHEGIVKLLFN